MNVEVVKEKNLYVGMFFVCIYLIATNFCCGLICLQESKSTLIKKFKGKNFGS